MYSSQKLGRISQLVLLVFVTVGLWSCSVSPEVSGVNSGIENINAQAYTQQQMLDAINTKWQANQWLGTAVSGHGGAINNGRYQEYSKGFIYFGQRVGRAHIIKKGEIFNKWQTYGWENSMLGYPITDQVNDSSTISHNDFEYGSIYSSSGSTPWTYEIHGDIAKKWYAIGRGSSKVGYPTTDEWGCPDKIGRFNHFQNGSIYWTSKTGAHMVYGGIKKFWENHGWETGVMGYPTSDVTAGYNYWVCEFEGGRIRSNYDNTSAYAEKVSLNVPIYTQQPYGNLCWATSTAMVISYLKKDTIDRTVTIAQQQWGNTNFNKGGGDIGRFMKDYTGKVTTWYFGKTCSATTIRDQLMRGEPMIIAINWKPGPGVHCIVIKSIEIFENPVYHTVQTTVKVNDPGNGTENSYSYEGLLDNSSFFWNEYYAMN